MATNTDMKEVVDGFTNYAQGVTTLVEQLASAYKAGDMAEVAYLNRLLGGRLEGLGSFQRNISETLTESELEGYVASRYEEGGKIKAIKAYRQAFGTGLKEASEAVAYFEMKGIFPRR